MENKEQLKVVTFQLGKEEYGINILKVHEIKRLKEITITQVPRAPFFVEGVINLRGDVIPIIDLRSRFGVGEKRQDKETRIIVVNLDEKYIGLIVDRVSEVLNFDEDTIDDPPDEVMQVDTYFVEGIGKQEERLVILLDIDKILTAHVEHETSGIG